MAKLKSKLRRANPQLSSPIRRVANGGIFPVVGVGASAGGFEAFKEVLENLPAETGMAFVLVQHLDPTHTSQLTELLTRVSPLPVCEIKDGRPVAPDHLYVIPPNTTLTISRGRLRLKPRRTSPTPPLPIDAFFQSLAADCDRRAIGVILSGTASDGVRGLEAIKAAGGITMAQDVASAKYDGMPQAAAAAGCVDFVLSPARIAAELLQIAQHRTGDLPAPAELPADDPGSLNVIFQLLQKATGVDFRYYKPPTVRRRIARRLAQHKLTTLPEYVAQLQQHPEEVLALYEDILINVTCFFRDPPVFEALQNSIFPKLCVNRPAAQPIRIWVPGCSTGEEVYSLAISLIEFLEAKRLDLPIQIFGSDISETSLSKARAGVYPASIKADVAPHRLRRFFTKVNGHYEISKSIRERCVFARQNLAQDPPFSRLDLVSCRNVLIYLGPVLQTKVLPIFHYALKPNGYLLLGTSETVSGFLNLFNVVNRRQRIYAKKPGSDRLALDFVQQEPSPTRPTSPAPPPLGETDWSGTQIQKEADRLLIARYTPPAVLVTEALEIVQFRGQTGPYLEPAPGRASLNLLKMVRDGLVADLRNAIQHAKRQNTTVRKDGIALIVNGRATTVNLEVVPVKAPATRARHFLVLFEAADPARSVPEKIRGPTRPRHPSDERAAELAADLRTTKEYLQSILEESEGANEELKAANEEIRSSNEELQCTNEELETAKEELQSTNEELTTVNEELQNRNQELSRLNNDVTNLLTSAQIPIVMLGPDLRIRRFTPPAEKVLNLIPTDVGRPFTDLKLTLAVPDLEGLITTAMETLSVVEQDVRDQHGRWYGLRIRPYRTHNNQIDGAVLALLDIDGVKRSLTVAQEARDFSEAIVATVREPLLVLTANLRVETANRSFFEKFHVTKKETIGQYIYELGNRQWDIPRLHQLLKVILTKNIAFHDFAVEHKFPEIGQRSMLLNARRLQRAGQTAPLILLAIEDLTLQKQAAEVQARLAAIIESSDDAITSIDLDGQIISWNKAAEQLYGYTAAEALDRPISLLIPADKSAELRRLLKHCRQGQKIVGYESVRTTKDGKRLDVSMTISPIRDTTGQLIGSSAVVRDITARKQAEAALRESEARFRVLFDEANDGMLLADVQTKRFLLANRQIQKWLGYSAAELVQMGVRDIHPAANLPRILKNFERQRRREIALVQNIPMRRKDGTVFYTDVSSAQIILQGHLYQLGIFRDVTERKRLESEIQQISETEKQRLGHDLHDGLSQQLIAVRFLASDLKSALAHRALPEAAAAAKIVHELTIASEQTHAMARGLCPIELKNWNLESSLAELAATVTDRFKITCRVSIPHPIHWVDLDAARQLYRIAQEATNNAGKHSHGKHILVRLVQKLGRIILTVKDDGRGVSKQVLKRTGMGMHIMQYRASLINADLSITRAPQGGTLVMCAVPTMAANHIRRRQG